MRSALATSSAAASSTPAGSSFASSRASTSAAKASSWSSRAVIAGDELGSADERHHAGEAPQERIDRACVGADDRGDVSGTAADAASRPPTISVGVGSRPGRWTTDDADDAAHGVQATVTCDDPASALARSAPAADGVRRTGRDDGGQVVGHAVGLACGRPPRPSPGPAARCRSGARSTRPGRPSVGLEPRRSSSASSSATSGTRSDTATLTSTCGSRVIAAAASSASGRPERCTTSSSTTPVSMPSPVVAWSAEDHVPALLATERVAAGAPAPRARSGRRRRSRRRRCRPRAIARRKPRLVIDRDDDGVVARAGPAPRRSIGADGDDVVAVDDARRCGRRRSTGRRRRRGRCPTSAPLRSTTAAASAAGSVAPQAALMLRAVRLVVDHDDVGTDALEHDRAATRDAAPLAASTTMRSPRAGRPPSDRHDMVDVRRRSRHRRSRAIAAGLDRRAVQRVELAARSPLSTSSGELRAAGGEQLDAVVAVRVVRGRHHRPHAPVRRARRRRPPASARRRGGARRRPPRRARRRTPPRASASTSRVSPPITTVGVVAGRQHPRRGTTEVEGERGGQLGVGDAADTVGPELHGRTGDPAVRISAW